MKNDIRIHSSPLKCGIKCFILYGVSIIHNKRFVLNHLNCHLVAFGKRVAFGHTEYYFVIHNSERIKFVYLIKVHINKGKVKLAFLNHISSPYRTIFK